MFRVIYQGAHGNTVGSENPKLDAYKQMALIASQGRRYRLIAQADGSYTIEGDGLARLTFEDEARAEFLAQISN
jgi:hypothetical protein